MHVQACVYTYPDTGIHIYAHVHICICTYTCMNMHTTVKLELEGLLYNTTGIALIKYPIISELLSIPIIPKIIPCMSL